MDLNNKVTALMQLGFPVGYAYREDGECGHLVSREVSRYDGEGLEPYVSFDSVARGECDAGQSDSVARSNFRSIQREYPDAPWVNMHYTNVEALGMFVADLEEDMFNLFCGLVDQWPVHDESDLSDLEFDEIQESWVQYAAHDTRGSLDDVGQDMWDYIGLDRVTSLYEAERMAADYWPEHSGYDVVWDYTRTAAIVLGAMSRHLNASEECIGQLALV